MRLKFYAMILTIDRNLHKNAQTHPALGNFYALFSKIHEYVTKGNLGLKKEHPHNFLSDQFFKSEKKHELQTILTAIYDHPLYHSYARFKQKIFLY